ncbi:MAG: phenylalanine--tRNA ligase subunit alpha [Candidatus Omnitrophica bacterium]|nr:phenylalanine--tRNA ligase subunit alpha [Candidatus Omnitrophota bacterium]
MKEALDKINNEFQKDYESISTQQDLEALKIKYLGRKSELNGLFSNMSKLSSQDRGLFGKEINLLKQKITDTINSKILSAEKNELFFDVTLPGTVNTFATEHILITVLKQICSTFEQLGFSVVEGTEMEDEWHNFSALNIPLEHPSRDGFDTFYLDSGATITEKTGQYLLRSHTSPSQIRMMENLTPPIAVVSPGRVYRPDEVDATHSFMFHQVEGFVVDKNISFANLKGVLLKFARTFFGPEVKLRFRPSFFPFTEPSAEVDVSCIICGGGKNKQIKKCPVCKDSGWLEILGCGMIHPNVLKDCKIDFKKYQGFAFGMGVERVAMLRYGIDDIRLFFENDKRFLEQFYVE